MANRNLTIDWEQTGLVGQISHEILNPDGSTYAAETVAATAETPAGSGVYVVSVPDTLAGQIIWRYGGEEYNEFFTPTAGVNVIAATSAAYANAFEYVWIAGPEKHGIRIAALRNLSTVSGSGSTDRGRMHGRLTLSGADVVFKLYSDVTRTREIISGVIPGASIGTGAFTEMGAGAAGTHGESARVALDYTPDGTINFVAIPSFADDSDVFPVKQFVAAMPGYDDGSEGTGVPNETAARGLAFFQAQAAEDIATVYLPAATPHLFGGGGLANFIVLGDTLPTLPDLRSIAAATQLRAAQAALALAKSAESNGHVKEMADMAAAARIRFTDIMDAIGLANKPKDDVAATTPEGGDNLGGVSFGEFRRN